MYRRLTRVYAVDDLHVDRVINEMLEMDAFQIYNDAVVVLAVEIGVP